MITTNIQNLNIKGQITGTLEPSYGYNNLLKLPKIGWDKYSNIDIPVSIDSYNDDGTVNCTVDLSLASPQQQTAYRIKHFFDLQSKLFNNML